MSTFKPFSWLLSLLLITLSVPDKLISDALEFDSLGSDSESSAQYKCVAESALINEDISTRDHFLTRFYSFVNGCIRYLTRPFPHRDLLSERLLREGDFDEFTQSFMRNIHQWIAYEQWWILSAVSLIILSVLFTFFYLIYSCCVCISNCSKDHLTDNGDKPLSDSRFDNCRRRCLNLIITLFIVINIFAIASLLISSQYAEYGATQLPHRLSLCYDDLLLYKRTTDKQIRRLLVDDFQKLNISLENNVSNAGSWLIQRLGQLTGGVQAVDQLRNTSKTAIELKQLIRDARDEIDSLNIEFKKFRIDFTKLRRTSLDELQSTCSNNNGGDDIIGNICGKVENLLNSIDQALPISDLVTAEKILPERIFYELDRVTASNLTQLSANFYADDGDLHDIEKELQAEIDHNRYAAQTMLKQIGDDLYGVSETISVELRDIDFDGFKQSMERTFNSDHLDYARYVEYSWFAVLALSGVYALIAVYFLFGLFYGMCGRRPTLYNDDCCVRSTGSKLFGCGIWLAVFVLVFLSVIASVMLLVGVNISSFVCQPLEDPLSRPDIISLGDRIVNLWKTERIEHDLPLLSYGTSSANSTQSLITSIIDGCSLSPSSNNYNNNNNNNNNNINTNKPAQKTFYEIFELDKKYRLLNVTARDLNGYQKLNDFIDNLANQMRINIETHMKNNNNNNINNILSKNIQKLTEIIRKTSSIFEPTTDGETTPKTDQENIIKLIEKVNKTLELLDFMPNTSAISDQLIKANLNQRVIQAVLNRLRVIELNSSEPLRNRIKSIVSNVTTISSKLSNLSQPLSQILNRLEESESMLRANFNVYLQKVIHEFLMNLKGSITDYIEHVQRAMSTEVTSCEPIRQVFVESRDSLCSSFLDPFNGAWASMLISIMCMIPTILLATCLARLYRNIYEYPKCYVYEPTSMDGSQLCAFSTDAYTPYDARSRQLQQQHYANGYGIYTGNGYDPGVPLAYMKARR